MLDIDKLYNIMDYSGNYYRIGKRNDLVIVSNANEASVFTFIEANKRINMGQKNKFYFMTPVEAMQEECQEEEMKPVSEYDFSQMDWKEYLTHFTYIIESLAGYRDSLVKEESDVDLKISDILHYIELSDTSDEEASRLVGLLKECREHRRAVKDEIICLDTFQRTVGTGANATKAKEAIKAFKGLETRSYTPRRLSDLFGDEVVKIPTTPKKTHRELDLDKNIRFENGTEWKETEDMDLVRRGTAFDGKDNDWMAFAMQQAEFYRDANQYMINIKVDIEEIEEEIADLMDEIDSSNCNVAQGYKLFKRLKELRIQRKTKEQELQCLHILTAHFDMTAMADECESNAYELERMLYPQEVVEDCDETPISEDDADAGAISKAV